MFLILALLLTFKEMGLIPEVLSLHFNRESKHFKKTSHNSKGELKEKDESQATLFSI